MTDWFNGEPIVTGRVIRCPSMRAVECPKCQQLMMHVETDEKHWPRLAVNNQCYRCLKCEYRGLEDQIESLRSMYVLNETTIRQLAMALGETFYYHPKECGFSGNWDVIVDTVPYRPAAGSFEGLVSLLSSREMKLAWKYRRDNVRSNRDVFVPKIVGF